MPSFDTINYSLRVNKSIQRSLVFEGLRQLKASMHLEDAVFVGMGSIWFADFLMAHKLLHIDEMISIELDEIGCRRARFNKPFRTVCVKEGSTNEVLPVLYEDRSLVSRPWFIWLDYDRELDEYSVDDLRLVVERTPPNSVFLATFSANGARYGRPRQRPDRLRALLAPVVPDDLSRETCDDSGLFSETLADLTLDFLVSVAADVARPGGFVRAFRILYRDTSPMVTVGGVLPATDAVSAVRALVAGGDWPSIAPHPVITHHLTLREVAVLQSQMPSAAVFNRQAVQRLGFDLEEDQIRAFGYYYKYYPAFAQITF
jgi:hypothetical protein